MTDASAWQLDEAPELARFQAMYLEGSIDGVALVAADDRACPTCLAVTDRSYIPSGLPRIPVAGCSAVAGCRCRYEPNVTVYE